VCVYVSVCVVHYITELGSIIT